MSGANFRDLAALNKALEEEREAERLELESARRVVNACRHTVLTSEFPGSAMNGACASCIAAYAQQIRADRRLMRQALEREQATSQALREALAAYVAEHDDFERLSGRECDCECCEKARSLVPIKERA